VLDQRKDQRRAQLEAQYAQRANGIRMQQQAQAQGMAGNPIYSTGAPIFYPPTRGTGFVYPQMVPRGRFPQQPRGVPSQYGMPAHGFMVPSGGPTGPNPGATGRGMPKGRAGPKGPRGGGNVGGPMQGYPMGIKYNANVRNQQIPVPQVPLDQATTIPSVPPESDRRQQIGEQIYPLVENFLRTSNQEDLSGKITGMFLDSIEPSELIQLLDSQEALSKKIQEALEVLAAHAVEAKKENRVE